MFRIDIWKMVGVSEIENKIALFRFIWMDLDPILKVEKGIPWRIEYRQKPRSKIS